MRTILLLTFKISPYKGSEAAVSWNYVVNMSKDNRIIVLYGRDKEDIDRYCAGSVLENVEFVHLPSDHVPSTDRVLRHILNYRKWHKQAYKLAQRIVAEQHVDVIHYLNPIGFKEPGYLYKIDKPYFWGPITGVHNRPFSLYAALGFKDKIDAFARFVLHNLSLRFSPRVRKALRHTDRLFTATPLSQKQFKTLYGKESIYLPENGILAPERQAPVTYKEGEILNLFWCGDLIPRKALIILLEALDRLAEDKKRLVSLHVVGGGEVTRLLETIYEDTQP